MANKKWYDNAVMINRDPNWYNSIDASSAEACRASLENYFSLYEGKVTDVMIGLLEQTTMVPSKAFMWRGEKYLQKTENGHEVDYTERLGRLYKCFAEYNVDAVQIFIDQMGKLGIRPWISLRMNDVHFGCEETSFLHSDMFYEEVAAGHNIGEQYGYYKTAYNFKYPRYRTAILGYIKELLDKYDIFGFELDFMREIYCFNYKEDTGIHEIMLDYVREVKKMVDAAGKRLGHDVKLSIRTSRSPKDAYEFGFDIKTMVDEGLVDIVVPTPRWAPTDSGVPISEWRELLGDKVGIIAGIESASLNLSTNTALNSKAYAAAFYAQGADGIYYNNHEYYSDRNRESWCVNRDTCLVGRREFIVTYQDIAAYQENRYKPLPLTVDGTAELPLELGLIKASDKVTLIIDFEGETAPTVSALGKSAEGTPCEPIIKRARGDDSFNFTPHAPLAYELSGIATDCHLPLTINGNGTVHYVQINIDAE